MAGAAALLVAAGIIFWMSDAGPGGSSGGSGDIPVVRRGASHGGGPSGGGGASGGGDGREASGRIRRFRGDGGVDAVEEPRVAVRTEPRPGSRPARQQTNRDEQNADEDASHTAGWRLGQARRRIEILEQREQTYRAAVDRFVEEGRDDTAARQRRVLQRVQGRLVEMRETEQELQAEAEADGTLGDVDRGLEEGEPPMRGPIQGGTASVR